jgi:hypothetical protein
VTNPVRSRYTSPTNIGGYLWSTVVARQLGIISPQESLRGITQTLTTLKSADHHEPSGMYFNWYDEATGEVRYVDPDGPADHTVRVQCRQRLARLRPDGGPQRRAAGPALADSLLNKMNFATTTTPRPGPAD